MSDKSLAERLRRNSDGTVSHTCGEDGSCWACDDNLAIAAELEKIAEEMERWDEAEVREWADRLAGRKS